MTIFDYPDVVPKQDVKFPAEIWFEETGFSDYWMHDIKFIDDKPVCKHSNHSCNRKELWNIAHTFDDIKCKEVCCRKCDVKLCGARCNGSEEPKEPKEVDVKGICDDGYCPDCGISLDDLVEKCPDCGVPLLWTHWKIVNEYEED